MMLSLLLGVFPMIHSSRFICSFSTSFFCRRTRKWTQRLIFSSRSRTRVKRGEDREKNRQQSWEEGERATEEELFQESLLFLSSDVLPSKNYLRSNESIETETAVASSTASWCFLTFSPLISFPSVAGRGSVSPLLWISLMSYSCHTCHPPSFSNFSFSWNDSSWKGWEGREDWRKDVSEDECPHKSFLVSHSLVNLIAHLHESP